MIQHILLALLILGAMPRQEFFFGLIVLVLFIIVVVEFVQTLFEIFGAY
jgi:hypothetical protein